MTPAADQPGLHTSTRTFSVHGMHCVSCANVISKQINMIDGVTDATVQYATERAIVSFDPVRVSVRELNLALAPYGYTLSEGDVPAAEGSEEFRTLAMFRAQTEFVLPIALLYGALMIYDIARRYWIGLPALPFPMSFMDTFGLITASVVLATAGRPFLLAIVRFLRTGVANMDTLVGIGTLGAFVYSAGITLLPGLTAAWRIPAGTYFDVTIIVIAFVVFGRYLEARSKLRTREAVAALLKLQAKRAIVIREGVEFEVPLEEVVVGDMLVIKPGATVPVDGVVVLGSTSIDESLLTGESMPVDKREGDSVVGGTLNRQGACTVRATSVGSDTVLSHIITLVEKAQDSRAPVQALADSISRMFVPGVLGIALVTVLLWLTVGAHALGFETALTYALLAGVGVLVIACPCALGLATPTAIIVGVGKGARMGVLFKHAEALERLSRVETVVFDKTGTLTKGAPEVTDIQVFDPAWNEEKLLRVAASAERLSEHPLATAIVQCARARSVRLSEPHDFVAHEGIGVDAMIDRVQVTVRKPVTVEAERPEIVAFREAGKTVVVVSVDGACIGLIAIADTVRADAAATIATLRAQGIRSVLLTGDDQRVAKHIAAEVGIETVISDVMPAEKDAVIQDLQSDGAVVAMVGDGVNDAPALARADVGIAMATGSDAAIGSAGVTLLAGDLRKLVHALKLARITMRTARQNLFWAFAYNAVGIPLAAGALYPAYGIMLDPVFAGIAMAGSSLSVVMNSLRLRTRTITV